MLELVKPPPPSLTYREFGMNKLGALVQGLGLDAQRRAAEELFDALTATWGQRAMGASPLWPSDITDDGTPFELSVAFSKGRPFLRVLAEAQDDPFDVHSNWEAGLRLTRELTRFAGVELARFERIAPVFAPSTSSTARFALWHAGTVEADGTLSFKVYLNPRVAGAARAPELVRDALARLGAEYAWEELAPKLHDPSQLVYLSLDLAGGPHARVKVYLAHPRATSVAVDALVRDASGYEPGLAQSWIEELTGSSGSFDARPILTCHAFRSANDATEVTVHVPTRCYVGDDAESVLRATELLGDAAGTLRSGVEAMAQRPLDLGRGLVTYVSLRPAADGPRLTAYLAPEAHAIATPRRTSLPPVRPSSAPTVAPPATESAAPGLGTPAPAPLTSFVRELEPAAGPMTFETVERVIAAHRVELTKHRFLERLEGPGTEEQARVLARRFTFYVLCFQDMLRLARELTTDPVLKAFAVTHEAEDRGHDRWFLHDLRVLGTERDLLWTFSAEHARTRDIAYRIMSLIVSAREDATRLAVLLALEGVGAEFFGRVIGFLERLDRTQGLRYFARSHQAVEQSHDVFEHDTKERLEAIVIPDAGVPEVLAGIARTFEALGDLGYDIDAAMAKCAEDELRVAG